MNHSTMDELKFHSSAKSYLPTQTQQIIITDTNPISLDAEHEQKTFELRMHFHLIKSKENERKKKKKPE